MEPGNTRFPNQGNSAVDFITSVMDIIITYSLEFWRSTNRTLRRVLDNLQITEVIDAAGDQLAEHPVLGFAVLAMALTCAVPIVIFIVFAIISMVFTFAGFIFVEGTLLAVGSLCLFGCLLSMILVMSMMTVILGMLYFAVIKIAKLLNSCEPTKALVNSMVPLLTSNDDIYDLSSSTVPDSQQD